MQFFEDKTDLEPRNKLKRFCYLGNFEPVYITPRAAIKVDLYFPMIKEILLNIDDVIFMSYMTEIVRTGECLPRKDEVMFVYATYLASDLNIKWRTNVRKAMPFALKTADDFFLFCKYSKLINESQERKGFSRTTKKAIIAWYEQRSPEQLREMWMSHRGLYGLTHKSLFVVCHISDDILGDTQVCQAFLKTCTELIEEDKFRGNVMDMCSLRTSSKKNEATRMVKNLKLNWDEVPPHLLQYPTVVESLMSRTSLMQLLQKWQTFHKYRHFENPKIVRAVLEITSREELKKANIHPAFFLWKMDRWGIPRTYDGLQKMPEKRSQSMRMPHFQQLFKDSFTCTRPLGLRTMVCMTLQDNYKKKFLTKHKKVSYYEAAVTLAYTYFKKERYADIFTFTEDQVRLLQIPFQRGCTLNEAFATCDKISFRKSSQRLVQPLMEALSRKMVYDFFLIIVPSGGRSNPGQNSTFLSKFLEKYRNTKNSTARIVILSLLKRKKSMRYSTEKNENILEICGLDGNTGNLIDLFATSCFI